MLLSCGAGENSWESLELPGDQTSPSYRKSTLFIGRTDAEAEILPIPPDLKSRLIGKDPDARKDWRQEARVMTQHEMVGCLQWWVDIVWTSFRNWCCTGKPGLLQSTGSQRVGHDWATELKQSHQETNFTIITVTTGKSSIRYKHSRNRNKIKSVEEIKSTCHPLFQGIFPTQASNPHLLLLLHW